MLQQKRKNKLISLLLAAAILLAGLLTGLIPVSRPLRGYAADVQASINFDNTDVMDDLMSSTVGDKPFSFKDYPANPNGKIQLFNFIEYCYSASTANQSYYGLYLYVYNPARISFNLSTSTHKVKLGTHYNVKGEVDEWSNFSLQFCSKTTGDYNDLFYKFKVTNVSTILKRINDFGAHVRIYDIASISLLKFGSLLTTTHAVGMTFTYTGFVAGYGLTSAKGSTLDCFVKSADEYIATDLHPVNYRPPVVSALGEGHQNDLSSVYFSIDTYFLEMYGKLQRIKAEWYEYRTSPIVVVDNKTAYDFMLPYVARKAGKSTLPFNTNVPFGFGVQQHGDSSSIRYKWSYNLSPSGKTLRNPADYFFYLFNEKNKVSPQALSEWIYGYNTSFYNGYLDYPNSPNLSMDLFEDDLDQIAKSYNRNVGYNCLDIDSDALFDMLSFNSLDRNWWGKVADFGFWNTILGKKPDMSGNYTGVSPIVIITDEHLLGDNDAISANLCIDVDNVPAFKEFCAQEKKKEGRDGFGKTVVLFHFAHSDFCSEPLDFIGTGSKTYPSSTKGFMAQLNIYLGFEIIEFTFFKNGVFVVIPAVCSPVDIINGVTSPIEPDKPSWLSEMQSLWDSIKAFFASVGGFFSKYGKYILIGLLILAVAIPVSIFAPIIFPPLIWFFKTAFKTIGKGLLFAIKGIFKGLWAVVSFPFKLFKRDG